MDIQYMYANNVYAHITYVTEITAKDSKLLSWKSMVSLIKKPDGHSVNRLTVYFITFSITKITRLLTHFSKK